MFVLQFVGLSLTCAVAAEDLQVGEVLDVQGGARHSEKGGEVCVGSVGRKSKSPALEMHTGLSPETWKSHRERWSATTVKHSGFF